MATRINYPRLNECQAAGVAVRIASLFGALSVGWCVNAFAWGRYETGLRDSVAREIAMYAVELLGVVGRTCDTCSDGGRWSAAESAQLNSELSRASGYLDAFDDLVAGREPAPDPRYARRAAFEDELIVVFSNRTANDIRIRISSLMEVTMSLKHHLSTYTHDLRYIIVLSCARAAAQLLYVVAARPAGVETPGAALCEVIETVWVQMKLCKHAVSRKVQDAQPAQPALPAQLSETQPAQPAQPAQLSEAPAQPAPLSKAQPAPLSEEPARPAPLSEAQPAQPSEAQPAQPSEA